MSTLLASYDPAKVSIQIAGVDIVGFPDGDMVTVSKNEDFFNNMVGTKGEVTRAVNRNNTGTITLRLQHTSPSIAFIQAMALTDGLGVPPILPFTVLDPSSHDKILATQVWLQADAEHNWGNETGVREYQFFAVNVIGPGNAQLAPEAIFGTARSVQA